MSLSFYECQLYSQENGSVEYCYDTLQDLHLKGGSMYVRIVFGQQLEINYYIYMCSVWCFMS